jgi:hypothetical protein
VILNALRGDTTAFSLTVPEELDDQTFTFTVKRRLLDSDEDAVISQTDLEASEGSVFIELLPEDTDQFVDAERLYWDLQADDGIGGITTPLRGKLVITADVTLTASEPS